MTNKNERLFKPQRGGRCPRGFELKTYKNIRGSGGEQLKKEEKYAIIIKQLHRLSVSGI